MRLGCRSGLSLVRLWTLGRGLRPWLIEERGGLRIMLLRRWAHGQIVWLRSGAYWRSGVLHLRLWRSGMRCGCTLLWAVSRVIVRRRNRLVAGGCVGRGSLPIGEVSVGYVCLAGLRCSVGARYFWGTLRLIRAST